MQLNDEQFEQYQQERHIVSEGARRVIIVACLRVRSRFTTDDQSECVDSLLVTGDQFPGCV